MAGKDHVTKTGVIHKVYLKKRAERPRHDNHVDYSAKRAVLVRKGSLELQWRFACTTWADVLSGTVPEPAALWIIDESEVQPLATAYLYNAGGRLSKALIMSFEKEIDEFFGEETACFVEPQMTLLLGPSLKDRK